LVASSYFFNPNYPLLAPKTLFLNAHIALFSHVIHRLKGFVYTIAVDIHA